MDGCERCFGFVGSMGGSDGIGFCCHRFEKSETVAGRWSMAMKSGVIDDAAGFGNFNGKS